MSHNPDQGNYAGAFPSGGGYGPYASGSTAKEPSRPPMPLGEAIRQLPSQYLRVLIKPGAATFAQEKGPFLNMRSVRYHYNYNTNPADCGMVCGVNEAV